MDQGGDGRRAFHRVGEPHVERKLGGFADGAAEEQEREERREDERVGFTLGGEFREVDGAVEPVAHHNTEEETEVTDAVGDERFF